MIELDSIKNVHFVGVGGYGMSALAAVGLERGWSVSGSDLVPNARTLRLVEGGMRFFAGHAAENLGSADLLVYSSAVAADNPELIAAKETGVDAVHRAALLAAFMKESARSVGVVGSHGKTTTASMIASVLKGAGLEPGFALGGELVPDGGNGSRGAGEIFVAELDESDGSFEKCAPDILVLTNIDNEHISATATFASMPAMLDAYARFLSALPEKAKVFYFAGDRELAELVGACARTDIDFVSFGTPAANVSAGAIEHEGMKTVFRVGAKGGVLEPLFRVSMPGSHNVTNALAALSACLELGVEAEAAARVLARFRGVKRRFEILAEREGVTFVEDYGHHPAEIRATIDSAAALNGRIVMIFQPHRYSRTAALIDEFARCFAGAGVLVVTEIYSAGEAPIEGVSGESFARACAAAETGLDVRFAADNAGVSALLAQILRPGDVAVFQGAGDIHDVALNVSAGYKRGRVGV